MACTLQESGTIRIAAEDKAQAYHVLDPAANLLAMVKINF
jgi:hypothetical protein